MSGSKQLIHVDLPIKEQFYCNADNQTWTLGSTRTIDYTFNKKGKYAVLDDLKIRFKPKNSSSNDTWDFESLWHLVEKLVIRINGKECYQFRDNLTKFAADLKKLEYKSKEAVQQREYNCTNGAGTAFHNSTTIAVSTTKSYYHASLNDVTDLFHDMRLCPVDRVELEFTMVSVSDTKLYDYISYDNSTGSESPSDFVSLVNADAMFEISYYSMPQTQHVEYVVVVPEFHKRIFTESAVATWIGTASQDYTISLSDWHDIQNIVKCHIYGQDAAGDNNHKQYLGLGIVDHIDFKLAGKTEYQLLDKYQMIEHILEHRRAHIGQAHWLLPNDTWVSNEEVPFLSLNMSGRNRHYGDGVHVREGMNNDNRKKQEIVLYNGALTDANMTRLHVVLESKKYIKIDRITKQVNSSA